MTKVFAIGAINFQDTISIPVPMTETYVEGNRIHTFKDDKYIRVVTPLDVEGTEDYILNFNLSFSEDIPSNTSIDVFLLEYYYPRWADIGNNSTLNDTLLVREEVRGSRCSFTKISKLYSECYKGTIYFPNTRREYTDDAGNLLYTEHRYYTLCVKLKNRYPSKLLLGKVYLPQEQDTSVCSSTALENYIEVNPLEFSFTVGRRLINDIIPIS